MWWPELGVLLELRILGSLELHGSNGPVRLGGGKSRSVLAALAVTAPNVISVSELIDILWPETPPRSAVKNLQMYIWQLRRAFENAGFSAQCIEAKPPGYRLCLSSSELDWQRFQDLAATARCHRQHDPQRALAILKEALALWRGPVFADVIIDLDSLLPYVAVFEEARWQALETRIDIELDVGEYGASIGELRELISVSPLRERLYEQLMLALYRSRRQAEALEVYRGLQAVLAEELGIDPSGTVQELQTRMLRGDPGLLGDVHAVAVRGRIVPRQLPAPARNFAGRAHELGELTGQLSQAAEAGDAMLISVLDGTAGIGKSALAVYWAHQVSRQFDGGQLYVDLRGYAPEGQPVAPQEAIQGFLAALEVPTDALPQGFDAQVAAYRTLLADRRVLVVLDNARDATQVRSLLPGTPRCAVLITSRSRFDGLIATDGARITTLGPLSDSDAYDLLARQIGEDRMRREPRAATELINLCAHLPLALSVLAARASAPPFPSLASIAAQLRDARRRLHMLDLGDAAVSVRAAFSWSYRSLRAPTARMFRLLGTHPGPDISAAAAASLAGMPVDWARVALTELARVHLVSEHVPGRYTLPDGLLRVYANDLANSYDSPRRRRMAVQRMIDHYLFSAHAAALLDSAQRPLALPSLRDGVSPECFADERQALTWWNSEQQVLLAIAELAASSGFDVHARQLRQAFGALARTDSEIRLR